MNNKKIDLKLKDDEYKNLLNFFKDRNNFNKFDRIINIDKYHIKISFYQSVFEPDILNVCFYMHDDTPSSKSAYISIAQPQELKHMCFKTDIEDNIVWIFNLTNMDTSYYMDISSLFSCSHLNKIIAILIITDFSNKIQIRNFCNTIFENIIDFYRDNVLDEKTIELVLNKFNYFGFEEKNVDLNYYKQKFETLTMDISDTCSFIIYSLNSILSGKSIDFIKSEIPHIGV